MWAQQGDNFHPAHSIPKRLPKGVYLLSFAENVGFYLKRTGDAYELPAKLYDIEQGLVERIIGTHKSQSRSVGVLLSGLKGTGKSVIAKQICNERELPVVVVEAAFVGLEIFLASFDEACVVFFDEFEKVFQTSNPEQNRSESVLKLLDGALQSPAHLYLMTTNNPDIGEFFIDRPSRIRYRVNFAGLDEAVVRNILNDRLLDKELVEQVHAWIATRAVVTVDAVTTVADEINLYGFDPVKMERWFNLNEAQTTSKVYRKSDNVLISSYWGNNPEGTYFYDGVERQGHLLNFNRQKLSVWAVEFVNKGSETPEITDVPAWALEDINMDASQKIVGFYECKVVEGRANAFKKRP